MKTMLLAALMFALVPLAALAQQPAPTGVWLYPNKRFEVAIVPCGDQLCGTIAWLKAPEDAKGAPRVDCWNADPALRARPLLGLVVLQGLHQVDDHTWEGGTIYNPDDGSHYSAIVSIAGDGTLHVHAYVLLAILGKTIVFTRVS